MVPHPGKTLRVSAYKPVNLPEPVPVEEPVPGGPAAVKLASRQAVTAIDDCWRIDDEWWRKEPISRLYYAVRFTGGQRLVIYKDLIRNQWYKQTY
jgi:hypothetical protein